MRCSLAVVGLLALTVVFSGCGGDSGETQEPIAVVAPPNPDSDLGPNSDGLPSGVENVPEETAPEKNPVARPSLLMEYMAKPLSDAMEPGSGEAPEKEEVEVEAVEVTEEASEESPGEDKPEAEESPDETKSDDDAKSEESPKEEEKPAEESPDDEKASAEGSPADDEAADESPSEDEPKGEPESDAGSSEGSEEPSADDGENDGADASDESEAG